MQSIVVASKHKQFKIVESRRTLQYVQYPTEPSHIKNAHTNMGMLPCMVSYKATRLLEGASNNTGRGTLSGGLMIVAGQLRVFCDGTLTMSTNVQGCSIDIVVIV